MYLVDTNNADIIKLNFCDDTAHFLSIITLTFILSYALMRYTHILTSLLGCSGLLILWLLSYSGSKINSPTSVRVYGQTITCTTTNSLFRPVPSFYSKFLLKSCHCHSDCALDINWQNAVFMDNCMVHNPTIDTRGVLPHSGEVFRATSMTRPLHIFTNKYIHDYSCSTHLTYGVWSVKIVKLSTQRHLFRKHDYIMLQRNIYWQMLYNNCHYIQHPQIKYIVSKHQLVGGAVLPRGRCVNVWTGAELAQYMTDSHSSQSVTAQARYRLLQYVPSMLVTEVSSNLLVLNIPMCDLVTKLPKPFLLKVAHSHQLSCAVSKHKSREFIAKVLMQHTCNSCGPFVCLFDYIDDIKSSKARVGKHRQKYVHDNVESFPPLPLSKDLTEEVIRGFAEDMSKQKFMESACAVCAQLKPVSTLLSLKEQIFDACLLTSDCTTTRTMRTTDTDAVQDIPGPVLLSGCEEICSMCLSELQKGKTPIDSLANGLWIGEVPPQLQDLSFTEKMLIARVKHNHCIVKVHMSGMSKLRANVVSHSLPMPKIYSVLPPKCEELDEVLAFLYLGPNQPTIKEYKRTPMLVRRNKVADALEWLKLNHIDYADLQISYSNLASYPEDEPPVLVNYTHTAESSTDPEAAAVTESNENEGTDEGDCPFVVHGLTGATLDHLGKVRPYEITARAIEHFKSGGKVLGIGQSPQPESLYHNPQLYPQMFPWLFPYGLGGLDNSATGCRTVSEEKRKEQLLMYHDKRFQLEPLFPLVALNHEQIKKSTSAGYLLADKNKFGDIANRLLNIKDSTLADIIHRLSRGSMKPETEEEKACFQILNDLDHVNYKVQGSITSKKYMRNEIWSLFSYLGAPSWFITFAPADVKHPIALYFADTNQKFVPQF